MKCLSQSSIFYVCLVLLFSFLPVALSMTPFSADLKTKNEETSHRLPKQFRLLPTPKPHLIKLLMQTYNLSESSRVEIVNATSRAAELADIEPLFVLANIRAESRFRQSAISNKGCRGLMQLHPAYMRAQAKLYGILDFNINLISDNVLVGAMYLKQMMVLTRGDPLLAVAAYNMGPTALKKCLHDGHIPDTVMVHARKVVRYWKQMEATSSWFVALESVNNKECS